MSEIIKATYRRMVNSNVYLWKRTLYFSDKVGNLNSMVELDSLKGGLLIFIFKYISVEHVEYDYLSQAMATI